MTKINPESIEFIQSNLNTNVDTLLLNAKKYPQLDMPFIVNQILSRRAIKEKLPLWYNMPELIFPSRLSSEQASSEITAAYKVAMAKGSRLVDLTGGLGIDSWSFARKMKEVIYIERFADYCEAAEYNFKMLGMDNITVLNGDSTSFLNELLNVDTFYIDPARRGEGNKRLFALEDCEPNVLSLKEIVLSKGARLIVKLSPMVDITNTLKQLPETVEVHVISVKNDCKELFFVLDLSQVEVVPTIHCVNFRSSGEMEKFEFTFLQESNTLVDFADKILKYLYEPNSSIMKAGAFKSVVTGYNLQKLHVNSHLYTSDQFVSDFPGRVFEVIETIDFTSKTLKSLSSDYPKANIAVRNFALTAEELKKRSRIADGGDIYLFGTTINKDKRVLIVTKKG